MWGLKFISSWRMLKEPSQHAIWSMATCHAPQVGKAGRLWLRRGWRWSAISRWSADSRDHASWLKKTAHPKRAMMILTSIFAPSYPSKLGMHDSCIVDMNDVYGPALGLWRDRLLRLTVLPKKRGERSDRFQVVLEDLFLLANSQSFDSLVYFLNCINQGLQIHQIHLFLIFHGICWNCDFARVTNPFHMCIRNPPEERNSIPTLMVERSASGLIQQLGWPRTVRCLPCWHPNLMKCLRCQRLTVIVENEIRGGTEDFTANS